MTCTNCKRHTADIGLPRCWRCRMGLIGEVLEPWVEATIEADEVSCEFCSAPFYRSTQWQKYCSKHCKDEHRNERLMTSTGPRGTKGRARPHIPTQRELALGWLE